MTEHFNKLTPAEAERLAILSEECGEVIHIIGKILRHGYASQNPDVLYDKNNRSYLEEELGDLFASVDLLTRNDDVQKDNIINCIRLRHQKINRYTHHQGD